MKKFFLGMLAVVLLIVVALPSVSYSHGYYGRPYYHNNYWVPAAIGGFLFGTIVGSAVAPRTYYAPPPPPPPPPRVYYYYPPPPPRVYVYPY
jgi:hypothetical protein